MSFRKRGAFYRVLGGVSERVMEAFGVRIRGNQTTLGLLIDDKGEIMTPKGASDTFRSVREPFQHRSVTFF